MDKYSKRKLHLTYAFVIHPLLRVCAREFLNLELNHTLNRTTLSKRLRSFNFYYRPYTSPLGMSFQRKFCWQFFPPLCSLLLSFPRACAREPTCPCVQFSSFPFLSVRVSFHALHTPWRHPPLILRTLLLELLTHLRCMLLALHVPWERGRTPQTSGTGLFGN